MTFLPRLRIAVKLSGLLAVSAVGVAAVIALVMAVLGRLALVPYTNALFMVGGIILIIGVLSFTGSERNYRVSYFLHHARFDLSEWRNPMGDLLQAAYFAWGAVLLGLSLVLLAVLTYNVLS